MIWNHTRAYGYDDDMTKKTSGKTEEKNRVEEHLAPTPAKSKSKNADAGKSLEKEIKRQNFSNATLSAETGVDEGSISRWTKGNIPTKVTTPLKAVCDKLRINAGKLVTDGIVEIDESIPEESTISFEEKAKRLLNNDVIGASFRTIVDSLFAQNCLRDRGQSSP